MTTVSKWPRPIKVMAVIEVFLVASWLVSRPSEPAVILAQPIIVDTVSTVTMAADPEASVATVVVVEIVTTTQTTTPPQSATTETTRPRPPNSTIGPTLPITTTAPITVATEVEQIIAAETDWVRISAGLSATIADSGLISYARDWAVHMAETGVFAHSDINVLLSQRWEIVGENLAQGLEASEVTEALTNSPAHLSIILNPAFTNDGIGVAVDAEGDLWVVQIFAGEDILPTTTTPITTTIPVPITTITVPITIPDTIPDPTIP